MNKAELTEVLRLHGLWLAGESGGIRADLAGANLTRANLTRAYLTRADLAGANLAGADLAGADQIPVVPDLHQKVAEAALAPRALEMGGWHTRSEATAECGMTHCRGGWAIVIAGEAGKALEDKIGSCAAAALIYHVSTGMVPDFFADNETAAEDIRRCVGLTADAGK